MEKTSGQNSVSDNPNTVARPRPPWLLPAPQVLSLVDEAEMRMSEISVVPEALPPIWITNPRLRLPFTRLNTRLLPFGLLPRRIHRKAERSAPSS